MNNIPPKPISDKLRPELSRLPELTLLRRAARVAILLLCKILVKICIRMSVSGLENIPEKGPFLVVGNHLGDADIVVGLAASSITYEILGKVELYDHWLAGPLLRAYGTIWVHRGRPDRRAIRAVLGGLSEGRIIALAPEGRQTLTGGLEEGTNGAAYLAIKAGVPILPVALTGTDNRSINSNLKKLKRTDVSITVGTPFYLEKFENRRRSIKEGTKKIMLTLAHMLPEEYRGIYQSELENSNGR